MNSTTADAVLETLKFVLCVVADEAKVNNKEEFDDMAYSLNAKVVYCSKERVEPGTMSSWYASDPDTATYYSQRIPLLFLCYDEFGRTHGPKIAQYYFDMFHTLGALIFFESAGNVGVGTCAPTFLVGSDADARMHDFTEGRRFLFRSSHVMKDFPTMVERVYRIPALESRDVEASALQTQHQFDFISRMYLFFVLPTMLPRFDDFIEEFEEVRHFFWNLVAFPTSVVGFGLSKQREHSKKANRAFWVLDSMFGRRKSVPYKELVNRYFFDKHFVHPGKKFDRKTLWDWEGPLTEQAIKKLPQELDDLCKKPFTKAKLDMFNPYVYESFDDYVSRAKKEYANTGAEGMIKYVNNRAANVVRDEIEEVVNAMLAL